MPTNAFGNPFALQPVQTTHLKAPKIPDPTESLARLIKMQEAEARAAAAARGPQEGDHRYGRYVMVPQKDGTKKPVWVWGTSPTERDAAESKVLGEATQAIISGDAQLQKDLADFENLSIPGRKEVLDRVRQQHAPRLAQTLGISGEDLSKQLTTGLEQSIKQREKAIDEAGVFTQLVQGTKQVFRNIKDAIGAIGETPAEQRARGQANAEATAQDMRENAFQDEIRRLEAEKRSSVGFQLDNWGRSAVMHATPLAAMIAPAIAGGAIGTLVAPGPGTLGGLVSGATIGAGIGGAIGAGLPAAGEALARVATDPNLTEKQKEDAIGQTALASGLTAGAIGAIPVGPANILRPALAKRALAKALPEGISGTVARQLTPAATAVERAAAERAFVQAQTRGWTPNLWQQMGLHGANAATLGGAFQVGSNAAYGWGTGQDVPLTEGLGEAMLSGAVLGVPFGVGGRINAARRRQRVGLNPAAQPDWANLGGTWAADIRARTEAATPTVNSNRPFIREVDLRNMNLPVVYEPGQAPAVADIPPIPTRTIIPPESPIPQPAGTVNPELAAVPNRWQRTPLPAGDGAIVSPAGEVNPQLPPPGAWPMGTGQQARQYTSSEAVRLQNLRDKIARERAELAVRRAEEDAQLQARQAEEIRKNLEEWRQALQPKPRQNTTVKSERTLKERGGTPLFEQQVPNPDPLGVLSRNRRQRVPGQAPDMVQLANADFVRSKPPFDAVYARVENAQSPEEITDLLKRAIEASAITRNEVEVIANNVVNDALRYPAVQRALETAKEPVRPVSVEDKFFATNPGFNEIYNYIDGLNSSTAYKSAAGVIKRAILEHRITPEQAEIMAQDFAAQLPAGDKANEVKGIRKGIAEAETEVNNAGESSYTTGDEREQAPYMEPNERNRPSRPDGTDNVTDSTVSTDTAAATPTPPDTDVRPPVENSKTTEERGDVGETPQSARPLAENPPITNEQGPGGTENSIRKPGPESAAAPDATRSEGTGEPQPAPEQRTGDAVNAEQVDERVLEPPAKPDGVGGKGTLVASGQNYSDPARYEVWEIGDVIASHDPNNGYRPTEGYPPDAQERDYPHDQDAQLQIRDATIKFDPGQIISDVSGATQGPPIVTKEGYVLGGNSRTMMVKLLYGNDKAKPYKDALVAKAQAFGLDPNAIQKMKQPMLVRVLDEPLDINGMAKKSREYNTSDAREMDRRDEFVSRGKAFTPGLIEYIANEIEAFKNRSGKSQTLWQYLTKNGTVQLANKLLEAGVIKPSETSRYLTKEGALNKEGMQLVNGSILGYIIDDKNVLKEMPDGLRNKLQGSLLELTQLQGAQDSGNLTGDLIEAIKIATRAHNRKTGVAHETTQGGLLGDTVPPRIAALALTLERANAAELRARFANYNRQSAALSKRNSTQMGLVAPENNDYGKIFDTSFRKPLATLGKKLFPDFKPGTSVLTEAIEAANRAGKHSIPKAIKYFEDKLGAQLADKTKIGENTRLRQYIMELQKDDNSGAIRVYDPKVQVLPTQMQHHAEIGKRIKDALNYSKAAHTTTVVESGEKLPEHLSSAHDDDAPRVFDPQTNTLYLISSNIPDGVSAVETWAQGQFANGGLTRMVPERERTNLLGSFWESMKGQNKALNAVKKEFDLDLKKKMDSGVRLAMIEELFGKLAETKADGAIPKEMQPLYDKAVDIMQGALKRIYTNAGYRNRGTKAQAEELLEMLAPRNKELKETEAAMSEDEPASADYMDMTSSEVISHYETESDPLKIENSENTEEIKKTAQEHGYNITDAEANNTDSKQAIDNLIKTGKEACKK